LITLEQTLSLAEWRCTEVYLGSHREAAVNGSTCGKMKIVFLDIDGVLNCRKTANPRKFPFIVDQTLLERLNRLLQSTGAQVVLASN
jgi:hypothetical protein